MTMHLSFENSTAMYKDLKTCIGGIRARDLLFWRRTKWPLCKPHRHGITYMYSLFILKYILVPIKKLYKLCSTKSQIQIAVLLMQQLDVSPMPLCFGNNMDGCQGVNVCMHICMVFSVVIPVSSTICLPQSTVNLFKRRRIHSHSKTSTSAFH
jgi:hypothetical protein